MSCCCGFGGGGTPGGNVPAWDTPIVVTHTQLQAAALTNSIVLTSLPAGTVLHGIKLKHSEVFDGPGITDYFLSIGWNGENPQGLLIEYDVENTAVGNTNFALSGMFESRNHAAAVNLILSARSIGANLDQSTTGSAQIWLLVSRPI
jgi:hypothetical protein